MTSDHTPASASEHQDLVALAEKCGAHCYQTDVTKVWMAIDFKTPENLAKFAAALSSPGSQVDAGEPVAWMYTVKPGEGPANPILSRIRWHEDNLAHGLWDEHPLYVAPKGTSGSGWQPIETAPRSSEPMLVVSQGGAIRIETGHYAHNMLHAAKVDGEECNYTHWAPLPKAPS